jgi:chorismate mutase / prephenate dehydratase
MQQLNLLRSQIDALDKRIVPLLNKRARLAVMAWHAKKTDGKKLFDPKREKAIIEHVSSRNSGPLSNDALKRIYKEIVRQCRWLSRPSK